jgi:hypothetical protein
MCVAMCHSKLTIQNCSTAVFLCHMYYNLWNLTGDLKGDLEDHIQGYTTGHPKVSHYCPSLLDQFGHYKGVECLRIFSLQE